MAEWKKLVTSGSNVSQLFNDAGYLTSASISSRNAFATASFNGTALIANSPSGTLNFASSSGEGLYILANSGSDTLTWGLAAIPNSSLLNSGSIIGSTPVNLGTTVTSIAGLTLTNAVGSGSFSGSFQGDGSGLTGVVSDPFPYTGSAQITGSLGVTGSINGLALKGNNSNVGSIAIGENALANNVFVDGMFSTGVDNIAIGNSALISNTLGETNIALGRQALQYNSVGNDNIAFGYASLSGNTSGSYNIAFGANTLTQNYTGSYNVAIGASAGGNASAGDRNVYIGYNAGASSSSPESDKLYIANAIGTPLIGGDFAAQTVNISGSLTVTGGMTGSLQGTASFANTATSSSYANNATSASYALTASFALNANSDLAIAGNTGTGTVDLQTQTLIVSGTANEITTAASGQTITIGLPTNVTIAGDLAVNGGDITTTALTASLFNSTATQVNIGGSALQMRIGNGAGTITIPGNLTVQGTTTTISSSVLEIADQFIVLASGSNTNVDGGLIIQNDANGSGHAFGYGTPENRWVLQSSLNSLSSSFSSIDGYITTTQYGLLASLPANPSYGGATYGYGNIYTATDTGEIFIYA